MKTSLFTAPFLISLTAGSLALAAAPTASQSAAAVATNPDGRVAAMVMAANDVEIKAGKSAESKATNPQVKAFAKHMIEDHTANDKQAMTLDKEINVKPEPNDKVDEMKKEADLKLADVETKTGKDFDKAYMDMQVAMHEQVLKQIETALVPMAQNPSMKSFLEATKAHVQQHLAQAKKINAMLK